MVSLKFPQAAKTLRSGVLSDELRGERKAPEGSSTHAWLRWDGLSTLLMVLDHP